MRVLAKRRDFSTANFVYINYVSSDAEMAVGGDWGDAFSNKIPAFRSYTYAHSFSPFPLGPKRFSFLATALF